MGRPLLPAACCCCCCCCCCCLLRATAARYSLHEHDLLVDNFAMGNVFTNGSGTDLKLDHHAGAPFANLWSNIDVGLGRSTLGWAGPSQMMPCAGGRNTFWNIRASGPRAGQQERLQRAAKAAADAAAREGRPALADGGMRSSRRTGAGPRVLSLDRTIAALGYGQVRPDCCRLGCSHTCMMMSWADCASARNLGLLISWS
jgi:hypothetical protein